jgi:heme exporter protein B
MSVPPSVSTPTEPSLFTGFRVVLMRDLTLALRRRSEITNPLVFFVIVVTLFPFSIGPYVTLLSKAAPGILWVAALLASMLALDGIFHPDYQDGSLEQLLTSPQPVSLLVLAKVLAHWVVSGVPLILLAPILGLLLHLPEEQTGVLVLSLVLGTPSLSLIGAIGVALTVGLRRGGVLLSLLVLPLYIPVLIFGAGAAANVAQGLSPTPGLLFLAAILALALSLAPLAAAAALKISIE